MTAPFWIAALMRVVLLLVLMNYGVGLLAMLLVPLVDTSAEMGVNLERDDERCASLTP